MSGSPADVGYDPVHFYDDPYPIYRRLRDDAPVYFNEERGIWVLSRYDDVQTAAATGRRSSAGAASTYSPRISRTGPATSSISTRRATTSSAMSCVRTSRRSASKSLEPFIRQRVVELIELLREQGDCDLASGFAQRLPLTMIGELWGVPRADHGLLEDWFVRMVGRVPGQIEMPEDVWVAAGEMKAYVTEAVRGRAKAPRDDSLSTLARAVADGRMKRKRSTE